MVIEAGRYTGNIVYNITASFRWLALQGKMTFVSMLAFGSALKLDKGKEKA